MTDSEDNCHLIWKRPNDVPYPNVWHVYEAVSKEGIKYKIKIQDIPLDRSSEAIDFMETHFDYNEPISRALELYNDKESAVPYRILRQQLIVEQKVSLMAVIDDDTKPNVNPEIIGVIILEVKLKSEPHFESTAPFLKKLFAFFDYSLAGLDVFEILQSDKYIYHMGVGVSPKYYGLGIGLELERGASYIGKAFGIKGSFIVFTSLHSQPFIDKLGCKLIKEVPYGEYKDENGEGIPVTGTPSAKFLVWEYK